jgi:hypothetical protein
LERKKVDFAGGISSLQGLQIPQLPTTQQNRKQTPNTKLNPKTNQKQKLCTHKNPQQQIEQRKTQKPHKAYSEKVKSHKTMNPNKGQPKWAKKLTWQPYNYLTKSKVSFSQKKTSKQEAEATTHKEK